MGVTVTLSLNGVAVPVELDDDALATIGDALAERSETTPASPWLYGAKAAAEYLSWPIGRVQKLTACGVLPHSKIGQRCAYSRADLDAVLAEHAAGRAVVFTS